MESQSSQRNLKAGEGISQRVQAYAGKRHGIFSWFKYPNVIDVNSHLKSNKQSIEQSNNAPSRKSFIITPIILFYVFSPL